MINTEFQASLCNFKVVFEILKHIQPLGYARYSFEGGGLQGSVVVGSVPPVDKGQPLKPMPWVRENHDP
ncbi:MAG: hypothetical protein Q8830_02690 [Candidatus Phytoplasma australasiaticum]|nr:hypothetical protein [Candidatus Phytoplasma australasiaticum]